MKYIFLLFLSFSYFVCSLCDENPKLEDLATKIPDFLNNLDLPKGIGPVNTSDIPSIEEGELILKEKCEKNGGNSSFDNFMIAREEFNGCLASIVNYTQLQIEIENAKPHGELEIVFSKYCKKAPTFKECVTKFTTALDPCLEPKEKQTKLVFQNVSESLLDFICFKEGDRIALFIAEGGPECISDKKEAIQHCLNVTMSKFIPKEDLNVNNLPVFKLEKEECSALRDFHFCVNHELEKCKETTPSNIVDSLIRFMMKQTPCNEFNLYPNSGKSQLSSGSSHFIGSILFISLLSSYLFR